MKDFGSEFENSLMTGNKKQKRVQDKSKTDMLREELFQQLDDLNNDEYSEEESKIQN